MRGGSDIVRAEFDYFENLISDNVFDKNCISGRVLLRLRQILKLRLRRILNVSWSEFQN